jgi:regulator of protease activity HflC (stomatin/prohibitin superfamily)
MNIANLTRLIASGVWIVLIAVIAVAVTRATRNRPTKGFVTAIISLAVFAVAATTISAGLVFIQPEERGVVVSAFAPKGYREQPLEPGLKWVIPFAEDVKIYPISKQTYTMSIASQEGSISGDDSVAARTADGQEIAVDASVIFQIDPAKVIDVHIAWQKRYEDDLVRAQARGIIRDAVSQYRVDEVISTERASMTSHIRTTLESKLSDNGLILVDFVLRNITFSPEYAAAVEEKQIAEQQALQAGFVVQSKKQEAEQARQVAQGQADAAVIASKGAAEARLIQAQAEAQALQYIADVLRTNPTLLQYQYITNLAPGVQTIFVPSDNQFILPLPDISPSNNP